MPTLYKHKNNTDVAFEILKEFYVKEKEIYKLKVNWWNISRDRKHEPWPMMIQQKLEIPRRKFLDEWEILKIE